MEKCLNDACGVPLEIMDNCCKAIDLIEVFAAKGSVLGGQRCGRGCRLLPVRAERGQPECLY